MRIFVAGNLGSGKSTLSRQLAQIMGARYEPRIGYEATYIADILSNPDRWSFEAQVSFIRHKQAVLREADASGGDFIMDRSPYEDVEIFGKYFFLRGYMDERSYRTYVSIARTLLSTIKPPDIMVFSAASPEFSLRSLGKRPREHEALYPPNHVETLHSLYSDWYDAYNLSAKIAFDPEVYDFRDSAVVRDLVTEIESSLQTNTRPAAALPQLDLFAPPATVLQGALRPSPPRSSEGTRRPVVYIAAPFTGVAIDAAAREDEPLLFEAAHAHGSLPRNYRERLKKVARTFERLGYDVVLPHRDINRWGRRRMTAEQVVRECLSAVERADLVFALIGTSFGSHMEVGVAVGRRIPIIAVGVSTEPSSFFSGGLRRGRAVSEVRVKTWSDLMATISSEGFRSTIADAVWRASSY